MIFSDSFLCKTGSVNLDLVMGMQPYSKCTSMTVTFSSLQEINLFLWNMLLVVDGF